MKCPSKQVVDQLNIMQKGLTWNHDKNSKLNIKHQLQIIAKEVMKMLTKKPEIFALQGYSDSLSWAASGS